MEVTDENASEGRAKAQTDRNRAKEEQEANLIKLAHKISDLRAIPSSPAADWSVKPR
jgi:hypothetical protein